jgi:hypothetical protein
MKFYLKITKVTIEGYRRHLKKKVNEICVLKCVCGKRAFRDMEGIFKKVNYIYMSASECVCWKEKKK